MTLIALIEIPIKYLSLIPPDLRIPVMRIYLHFHNEDVSDQPNIDNKNDVFLIFFQKLRYTLFFTLCLRSKKPSERPVPDNLPINSHTPTDALQYQNRLFGGTLYVVLFIVAGEKTLIESSVVTIFL